jgi:serine/threonine-protein kinase
VLPIACGKDDEYLADGLLDDLIDTLSTSGLRVRPAGLVRAGLAEDPRAVGARLAVDHVVAASIRRTPTGLRVTARLIGVADGFQIWAHREDCTEPEILAVSETLGRGVAAALSTRATAVTRPTDPRAVDLYLRARAELRRFWGSHAQAAAELLEQAIEYAPASPPIAGALAYASVQAWVLRGQPELLARAKVALERGLATGHGEAYLASAIYRFNTGELERGAADLGTALVRAPMSGQCHEIAGRILVEIGVPAEARHHFETACGLDPGRAAIIAMDLARLDALEGNWAGSFDRLRTLTGNTDSALVQLGAVIEARLLGWQGNRQTMIEASAKMSPRMGDSAGRIVTFMQHVTTTGEFDGTAWRAFVAAFSGVDRPVRAQLMGLQLLTEIATIFGQPQPALDALDEAARRGLMDIVWLDQCPLFADASLDPAFQAIRGQVAARAARVLDAFRSVVPA